MHPDDLERFIDRRLRALPPPRAPRSLLPRVMAAMAARPIVPWYRRGWAEWPPIWQLGSLTALVLLCATVVLAWPYTSNAVASVSAAVRSDSTTLVPAPIASAAGTATSVWSAAQVLWRVLVQPVIGYLVAFVLTMFLACVAFGTAFDRVALGGPSEL